MAGQKMIITRRKWGIPKIVCKTSIVAAKNKTNKQTKKTVKNSFEATWKVFYTDVSTLKNLYFIFNPGIPYQRVRLYYFGRLLYIFVFLIPSLFSEVAGSSLGSFLYFYSKRMREVQWSPDIDELTRYSRLDKIWIKHDFQARYVIVVINYNSTLSFWNQKEQCPFVTFEHSYFEESC